MSDTTETTTATDHDTRPWIAEALGLDIETSWGVLADAARTMRHQLAQAEAAIAAVRELHRKASHGETCVYCAHGQRLGYDTTWPCDTIRALGNQQSIETEPDGREPDCTCDSDDNTHDSGCATAARWALDTAASVQDGAGR
jgi:hypothetical protein